MPALVFDLTVGPDFARQTAQETRPAATVTRRLAFHFSIGDENPGTGGMLVGKFREFVLIRLILEIIRRQRLVFSLRAFIAYPFFLNSRLKSGDF